MIEYRPILLKDAAAGYHLSMQAGWNQTLSDWNFMLSVFPVQGFVALEQNEVIGTAISMNYTDDFSWISMVLVDSTHRGKGIATKLMTLLLHDLGHERCIQLDATALGKSLYEKFGFKQEGTINRLIGTPPRYEYTSDYVCEHFENKELGGVQIYEANPWQKLRWELFVKNSDYKLYGIKSKASQKQIGYGMKRHGRVATQLGPIIAHNEADAKNIIQQILCDTIGPILVDVPSHCVALSTWLYQIGMAKQRDFIRMSNRGHCPDFLTIANYCMAGPEYG